jgi:hypothetical protein
LLMKYARGALHGSNNVKVSKSSGHTGISYVRVRSQHLISVGTDSSAKNHGLVEAPHPRDATYEE